MSIPPHSKFLDLAIKITAPLVVAMVIWAVSTETRMRDIDTTLGHVESMSGRLSATETAQATQQVRIDSITPRLDRIQADVRTVQADVKTLLARSPR